MTNTETPVLRRGPLLQVCLEQATVFPANHNQSSWFLLARTPCGSTGCLAGHAALLGEPSALLLVDTSSFSPEDDGVAAYDVAITDGFGVSAVATVASVARELLGITHSEAAYLFDGTRTLDEMWSVGAALYPGEVSYPSEARIAEVRAAGPLLADAVAERGVADYDDGAVVDFFTR